MSKIIYQTEGRVGLACIEAHAKPCFINWQKDGETARLHHGNHHIHLSRSQLLELAELAPQIAEDLVGGEA